MQTKEDQLAQVENLRQKHWKDAEVGWLCDLAREAISARSDAGLTADMRAAFFSLGRAGANGTRGDAKQRKAWLALRDALS